VIGSCRHPAHGWVRPAGRAHDRARAVLHPWHRPHAHSGRRGSDQLVSSRARTRRLWPHERCRPACQGASQRPVPI